MQFSNVRGIHTAQPDTPGLNIPFYIDITFDRSTIKA